MDINKLLNILHTAETLKDISRHSYTSNGRHESVAEHTFRLSLMAYFVKDEFSEADIDKVIKMCLIHDLGEAFTGDIPSFEKTSADEETEKRLLFDWINNLPAPYNTEMIALYREMEERNTLEAKLFKALDGLEAVIQHNEADLSTWSDNEYEVNLTYAEDICAFSTYLSEMRSVIKKETLDKIDKGNNTTAKEDEKVYDNQRNHLSKNSYDPIRIDNKPDVNKEKTKSKPITKLISIISIAISIISLFVSSLTAFEMHKTNSIAVYPDLRIKDDSITIYWDENGKLVHLSHSMEDDYTVDGTLIIPGINVINIGTSTAKDITVDWSYRYNLPLINDNYSMDSSFAIEEKNNKFMITEEQPDLPNSKMTVSQTEKISFIIENEEHYQTFPLVYLDVLSQFCHQNFPNSNNTDYSNFFSYDDLPKFKVRVDYSNNIKEKMNNEIQICFKPIEYKSLGNGAGCCTLLLTTETISNN